MGRRSTNKAAGRASNESNEPESLEGSDDEAMEVYDKVPDDEDEKAGAKAEVEKKNLGAKAKAKGEEKNSWPWPPVCATIELVNERIDGEVNEEKSLKTPNKSASEWLEAAAKSSFAEIAREVVAEVKTQKQILEALGKLMEQKTPKHEHMAYQEVVSDMFQEMIKSTTACLIETDKKIFPDEKFDAAFKKFVGKFLGLPGGEIEK